LCAPNITTVFPSARPSFLPSFHPSYRPSFRLSDKIVLAHRNDFWGAAAAAITIDTTTIATKNRHNDGQTTAGRKGKERKGREHMWEGLHIYFNAVYVLSSAYTHIHIQTCGELTRIGHLLPQIGNRPCHHIATKNRRCHHPSSVTATHRHYRHSAKTNH
jgi:hypothetical protein